MAKITDVPAIYRPHAKLAPEDILARLTPGELRYRCAHADDMTANAVSKPDFRYRHLIAEARKMLRSVPAAEYVKECKRLSDVAASSSGDVRSALFQRLLEYRGEHAFPPGLVSAIDGHFLGKTHPDQAMDELADACVRAAA